MPASLRYQIRVRRHAGVRPGFSTRLWYLARVRDPRRIALRENFCMYRRWIEVRWKLAAVAVALCALCWWPSRAL
ncbi:MAG: hypothetical protein QM811_22645 [Pirellulales bacterium]